ncbi:hypothetical protein V1477_009117 [Vespula maculifrons]|uniref:Uncharacterized protein n=1 Tax=Vespula maculifrons TaxID=7453 RepID=A0ABD2CHB5_VESMC
MELPRKKSICLSSILERQSNATIDKVTPGAHSSIKFASNTPEPTPPSSPPSPHPHQHATSQTPAAAIGHLRRQLELRRANDDAATNHLSLIGQHSVFNQPHTPSRRFLS